MFSYPSPPTHHPVVSFHFFIYYGKGIFCIQQINHICLSFYIPSELSSFFFVSFSLNILLIFGTCIILHFALEQSDIKVLFQASNRSLTATLYYSLILIQVRSFYHFSQLSKKIQSLVIVDGTKGADKNKSTKGK